MSFIDRLEIHIIGRKHWDGKFFIIWDLEEVLHREGDVIFDKGKSCNPVIFVVI